MIKAAPVYLDSSILVAALVGDEDAHGASVKLLGRTGATAWTHALAETFSTLTGGRLGRRVPPSLAVEMIRVTLVPRLRLIELDGVAMVAALGEAEEAGVRGGAIYDFLHLRAAAAAGARALITLDERHFQALVRPGDPVIEAPR
jgi:predicted nucleic acid-binding protein